MRVGATRISPVVLRQEVGRRIRQARQDAELTIVVAAQRLELTRSALSRLENGISNVTVHLLRSMMDVYDVRMDDVLDLIRQERSPAGGSGTASRIMTSSLWRQVPAASATMS